MRDRFGYRPPQTDIAERLFLWFCALVAMLCILSISGDAPAFLERQLELALAHAAGPAAATHK